MATEHVQDLGGLTEALGKAPFGAGSSVDASLRAWRALANLASIPPPVVNAGQSAWANWQAAQLDRFEDNAIALEGNAQIPTAGDSVQWSTMFGNLPLFGSYWWDARLEIYHVRHRVYDPELGRWLQRDPIGYAGGDNLYGYVGEMPMEWTDPLGLWFGQGVWQWARDAVRDAWESVSTSVSETSSGARKWISDGLLGEHTPTRDSEAVKAGHDRNKQLGAEFYHRNDNGADAAATCAALHVRNGKRELQDTGLEQVGNAVDNAYGTGLLMEMATAGTIPALVLAKRSQGGFGTGKGPDGRPGRFTSGKHHPQSSSPEPPDAGEVYERSVPDGKRNWYGMSDSGEVYRFAAKHGQDAHWNGRSNDGTGLNIPSDVWKNLGGQGAPPSRK